MKDIHIGERIKETFTQSPITMVRFAELTGLSRAAVYKIFTKPSIRTDHLVKIGDALNHNFFQEFSEQHRIWAAKQSKK